MDRREFLKNLAKLSAGACCAAAFGPLGSRYAFGQSMGGNGKTAIFLNQFGGCDPLNSLSIPYNLGDYYDVRPTIGIQPEDLLTLNNSNYGFHPTLPNLQRIFNDGDVAVITKIGDPRGTRSHFTSQDIMSRGTTEKVPQDRRGWMGRLGDLYFENIELNTLSIGVGNRLDLNANRSRNSPLAVGSLGDVGYDSLTERGSLNSSGETTLLREKIAALATETEGIPGMVDSSRRVFDKAVGVVNDAEANYSAQAPYETGGVSNFLRQVATLTSQNVGTKVFYGGIGGWDNHSNQGGVTGTQASRLSNIDIGLGHFETDMKAQGKWNDVTIAIYTEFGRTISENGGAGTDHGWGFTMVLLGGDVNGGVYGADIVSSDIVGKRQLEPEVDFRNPFSEMITWLGFNPDPVFPQAYEKQALGLLA